MEKIQLRVLFVTKLPIACGQRAFLVSVEVLFDTTETNMRGHFRPNGTRHFVERDKLGCALGSFFQCEAWPAGWVQF